MARVGVMEATEEVKPVDVPPVAHQPVVTPTPKEETPAPAEAVAETPPDPNEALYEGGPIRAQVEAWKTQFGDVYVTEVGDEKYIVWRTLTRFEYRRLIKTLEQQVASGQVSQAEANLNNEEAISELCILHPALSRTNMAGEMAGIPSIISQQVMEASAFVSVQVRQL